MINTNTIDRSEIEQRVWAAAEAAVADIEFDSASLDDAVVDVFSSRSRIADRICRNAFAGSRLVDFVVDEIVTLDNLREIARNQLGLPTAP